MEISKKTGAHPERMAGAMVALAIRDSAVLSKMGGLPRQKQGKSKRECIKIYLPHGAKEKARAVAECIGWRVNALAWYALMVHLHDLRKQLGLSDGQELRVSKSHRRELARRRVLVERTYIHGGIWPSRN